MLTLNISRSWIGNATRWPGRCRWAHRGQDEEEWLSDVCPRDPILHLWPMVTPPECWGVLFPLQRNPTKPSCWGKTLVFRSRLVSCMQQNSCIQVVSIQSIGSEQSACWEIVHGPHMNNLEWCILGNYTLFSLVIQVKIIRFVLACIIDQTPWKHQVAEYFIVFLGVFWSVRNSIFSLRLALHYLGFLSCVTDHVPRPVCGTCGCWCSHLTA